MVNSISFKSEFFANLIFFCMQIFNPTKVSLKGFAISFKLQLAMNILCYDLLILCWAVQCISNLHFSSCPNFSFLKTFSHLWETFKANDGRNFAAVSTRKESKKKSVTSRHTKLWTRWVTWFTPPISTVAFNGNFGVLKWARETPYAM